MLVTADQVKHATELTRPEIIRALGNSGYGGGNEITGVEFKGFTGTTFVYEITYPSPEDEDCDATGNVYVTLKRRPFSSEFDFYAEY